MQKHILNSTNKGEGLAMLFETQVSLVGAGAIVVPQIMELPN